MNKILRSRATGFARWEGWHMRWHMKTSASWQAAAAIEHNLLVLRWAHIKKGSIHFIDFHHFFKIQAYKQVLRKWLVTDWALEQPSSLEHEASGEFSVIYRKRRIFVVDRTEDEWWEFVQSLHSSVAPLLIHFTRSKSHPELFRKHPHGAVWKNERSTPHKITSITHCHQRKSTCLVWPKNPRGPNKSMDWQCFGLQNWE